MPTHNIFIGSRVLLPGIEGLHPAAIVVDLASGKITEVRPGVFSINDQSFPSDAHWIDAESKVILPGLVDAHVHLNEPGRTEWEGFWTGTRAAVSGGITTVVDMPLNSIPPTVTVSDFETKRAAAKGKCFCDVAFWGGVIPGNQGHLKPLVEAGVKGFKCFLIESGVEEFPCVSEDDLHSSMELLQDLPSTTLLFHAELETSPNPPEAGSDCTSYNTFLQTRPQDLEINAIALITRLQKAYPSLRCHIVHLSAASALPIIRAARASGAKLTVETCFHYLCLSSDDIPSGRPEFKCCPPIREENNRDLLWDALKEGVIDCVVSDHSPCVAELKLLDKGDIMGAWGGISSLGIGLSLLWTEGQRRGVSLGDIVKWTSLNTAKHAGLEAVKGVLAQGYDGDIIFWDPDAQMEITAKTLNFRNKVSPYVGMKLQGRVEKTYLRGSLVYDWRNGDPEFVGSGNLL
ncbi:Allantoinase [Marasmius crinis-equi]|uniref:allantoinase n=1 Tax=Marasmius crinis-equi TaxID=585013 RepID=A0ABR3FMZ2_9AGAR